MTIFFRREWVLVLLAGGAAPLAGCADDLTCADYGLCPYDAGPDAPAHDGPKPSDATLDTTKHH